MMLMTHSEGDKIGIRGHIAAENYKLLLLVNGVNITNNFYEGALMELDQWQMDDIERIEIIRGPGSVTYGSGAIAGVINIITKSAFSGAPMSEWKVSYSPEFRSSGFSFQSRRRFGDWGAYFYGSVQKTDGQENPKYFHLNPDEPTDVRYIGHRSIDEKGPQPYLEDTHGRPQIKLHLDLDNNDKFKVWARYTQSGQSHHFRTFTSDRDENDNLIEDTTNRNVSLRNFVISPEYTTDLSDTMNLKLRLSYDDQEYIRYRFSNVEYDIKSPANIRDYAFSQKRFVASALFDYHSSDRLQIATGFEFNRTGAYAPWGKSSNHLLIREGKWIINDADSSVYLDYPDGDNRPGSTRLEEVGNSLQFDTISQLSEATYKLSSNSQLIYAHRLDVPDIAETMYAPRLSYILDLPDQSTVRTSIQRSLRMMPLRAQYLYDKDDRDSSINGIDHEKLDSLEVAYSKVFNESTLVEVNAYYNDMDTVGYTGTKLEFLGDMQLFGIELQAKFQWKNTTLIANHSYLNLIDWTMNPDLRDGINRNNISFSDYLYTSTRGDEDITVSNYGNSLNNWSTNSSRLILTSHFMDRKLVTHISARMNWDHEGSYDEMEMFQRAYDNFNTSTLDADALALFENQRSEFERERALLDAEDAYQQDLSVNASLSYSWETKHDSKIVATLYAANILGDLKRYYVSTGSSREYPQRLQYLEEPTSIGLRISVKYR